VVVTERVSTGVHLSAANARYLATKARRGAHRLDVPLTGPHTQGLAGGA
jgi:GTP cyclohydrolase II